MMVRYVRDPAGRFQQRPFWSEAEIDQMCERRIEQFLQRLHGKVEYPISTEDLKTLIEDDARDLDQYADLSEYGADVEGLTEFEPGKKPRVRIAANLAEDDRRENRLRTTLTHEYGHARFHAFLFDAEPRAIDLFDPTCAKPQVVSCKRGEMLDAPAIDWMEWQAGHMCGALLMPATAARRVVRTVQERHGVYGAVTLESQPGRAMVEALVAQFQVSAEAARVRLRRLGHLGVRPASPALFGRA